MSNAIDAIAPKHTNKYANYETDSANLHFLFTIPITVFNFDSEKWRKKNCIVILANRCHQMACRKQIENKWKSKRLIDGTTTNQQTNQIQRERQDREIKSGQ